MLAQARAKPCRVAWQQAAAERLPYADESFDLVVSVTALEFMRDPRVALEEMHRVLVPGGRLVVGTLNALGPWGRFYARLAADPAVPFYHASLHTPERLVDLLSMIGPVRWQSAVFVPPSGRGLAIAGLLERLGQRYCRRKGALVVGRVRK
jgi:SAM-dependent methyltransferase